MAKNCETCPLWGRNECDAWQNRRAALAKHRSLLNSPLRLRYRDSRQVDSIPQVDSSLPPTKDGGSFWATMIPSSEESKRIAGDRRLLDQYTPNAQHSVISAAGGTAYKTDKKPNCLLK